MEPTSTGGMPPESSPPEKKSNRAMTSLVLGIVGIVCCGGVLSPFAWVMGKNELAAINAGTAPRENEAIAKAGKILGIIGSVLLVFTIIWFVLSGFAMLTAFMSAAAK